MESIDGLPPEARFVLRTLHAGRPLADAAALLELEERDAAKRLRAAAARARVPVPAPAAGTGALLEALAPLIATAGRPPERPPATSCPPADVLRAMATHGLAGPLLLATAEHAADCPGCLATVLAHTTDVAGDPAHPWPGSAPVGRPRKPASAISLPVVAICALLAGWLFLLFLLLSS